MLKRTQLRHRGNEVWILTLNSHFLHHSHLTPLVLERFVRFVVLRRARATQSGGEAVEEGKFGLVEGL